MNERLRNLFRIEPEVPPGEEPRPRNPYAFGAIAAAVLAYVLAELWDRRAGVAVLALAVAGVALGATSMWRARRDRLQGSGLSFLAIVASAVSLLIAFGTRA